jgi:hypothetical protein
MLIFAAVDFNDALKYRRLRTRRLAPTRAGAVTGVVLVFFVFSPATFAWFLMMELRADS